MKIKLKVKNTNDFEKLIEKLKKEVEQVNETLTQLDNFELEVELSE